MVGTHLSPTLASVVGGGALLAAFFFPGVAAQVQARDYVVSWSQEQYNSTASFCLDFNYQCSQYLGTVGSTEFGMDCDLTSAGPDTGVFCSGNTYVLLDKQADFTLNIMRFVGASLISEPEVDIEAEAEKVPISTTPSNTTSPLKTLSRPSTETVPTDILPVPLPIASLSAHLSQENHAASSVLKTHQSSIVAHEKARSKAKAQEAEIVAAFVALTAEGESKAIPEAREDAKRVRAKKEKKGREEAEAKKAREERKKALAGQREQRQREFEALSVEEQVEKMEAKKEWLGREIEERRARLRALKRLGPKRL